ncbi:hypothetical protein LZD49_24385 [Dyadobacter sp. CY261]|nr:hypothetical protein [Dyadobacter sp. CY261]MCF0073639.1 hypothetical protein [Dyadobacter sp. CY261]
MKTQVKTIEERKKQVLSDPRVQAIIIEKMEAAREFIEGGGLEKMRAAKH